MKNINELLPTTADFKHDISVVKETDTEIEERAANVVKAKYRLCANVIDDEELNIGNTWKFEFVDRT